MVLVAFSEVFGTARTLCEVAPGRVRPGVFPCQEVCILLHYGHDDEESTTY